MGWTTNLRILAFCRRAVIAIESIGDSLRTMAHLAEDDWNSKHAPKPKAPVTLAYFDPAEASKRWEQEQELKRVAP